MESLLDDLEGKKTRFATFLQNEIIPEISKQKNLAHVMPGVCSFADVIKTSNATSLSIVLSMMLSAFKKSFDAKTVPPSLIMACPEIALMLSETERNKSDKLFSYLSFFIDAGFFLTSNTNTLNDG